MRKRKWNKKRLGFLSLIVLVSITVMIIAIYYFSPKEEVPVYELKTLQEILEHYQCKLIKKENSKEENIQFDIYVNFDRDYYTKNESNEGYFSSLNTYVSENLKYENYRLIDTKRNINIVVLCNKEEEAITVVYYNGDRNYYEKKENEQNVENYKEINTVNLKINSKELQELISNNWQSNKINFGTKESTFEEYDIFFEEGIKVKTTATTIYNIVFTEKYGKEIVNGLKVNTSQEKIQQTLGTPAFSQNNIIGYKGQQCYIFFSENEVSVYRIENNYKNEQFVTMLEEFMTNRKRLTLFNTLTDIWNDYDLYTTENGNIFIRYTVKGIEFSFTPIGGRIIFYQNFGGQLAKDITLKDITKDNIPEYADLELTTDLVWKAEQERVDTQQNYYDEEFIEMLYTDVYTIEELEEGQLLEKLLKIEYKTENFYVFRTEMKSQSDNLKFISIHREYPDSELKLPAKVSDFAWLDENNIIYAISRKRNIPI